MDYQLSHATLLTFCPTWLVEKDTVSYQLSHATEYSIVIVLTTEAIISSFSDIVKVSGRIFLTFGHFPSFLHFFMPTFILQSRDSRPERRLRSPLQCAVMRPDYLSSPSGRRTVKVAPWPGTLSTVTEPSQRSTMRLTSDRPRPLPSVAWAVSPW